MADEERPDPASLAVIVGWHAHLYYDGSSLDRARAVIARAAAALPVAVGRMHQRPVGPHPRWSCQLAFGPQAFPVVVPWLALHRDGLTVFIHPETGRPLSDHRDRALWMGRIEPLALDALPPDPA